MAKLAAPSADVAGAAALEPGGRWNGLIGAVVTFISGARSSTQVSARDYDNYDDSDVNWRVVEGYGARDRRAWRRRARAFGCPVRRIDHSGKRLNIETANGHDHGRRAPSSRCRRNVLAANGRSVRAGAAGKNRSRAQACRSGSTTSCSSRSTTPRSSRRTAACSAAPIAAATAAYHIRPFGRPHDRRLFRRRRCAASWKRGGRGRLLRFRGDGTDRPARQRFRQRLQADRACIAGAPIRSRAAPIPMRCPARPIAARRSPRRSTIACSSPARPVRSTTTRRRTAPIAPASPPPSRFLLRVRAGRSLGPRRRLRRPFERRGHGVVDPLQPDELELLARASSGMSSKSRWLRAGSITRLMPARARRQHLLLDAADRQHQAAQADLAGHGDVAADGAVGQQRGQRHEHGDARARPVLRHRARRHVHVDVALLEAARVDAEQDGRGS